MSLHTPVKIKEDDDKELLNCLKDIDYSFENIEDKVYNKQLRRELEEVMKENNSLNEREILKLHYGWYKSCMSLQEIGEMFDISSERVRQLESKAMRKIRSSNRQG